MTRRKSGGREARIALRNAPLKEEEKPVNAGEIGGRYKPLVTNRFGILKPIFIEFLKRLDLVMQLPIV